MLQYLNQEIGPLKIYLNLQILVQNEAARTMSPVDGLLIFWIILILETTLSWASRTRSVFNACLLSSSKDYFLFTLRFTNYRVKH